LERAITDSEGVERMSPPWSICRCCVALDATPREALPAGKRMIVATRRSETLGSAR